MIFDFSNTDLYNPVYIPFFYDTKRYNIYYGGRDSGKSDDIAIKIIINTIQQEYSRTILMRKYFRMIKDSQFQTLVDIIKLFELNDLFHITDNPLRIVCKLNSNMILSRGLDDPKNAKSIKDPTSIWYEEADEISEEAFLDSSLSLRTSRNTTIKEFLSFNPSKEKSWINRYFFPENKREYEKDDGHFHWVNSIHPNASILHTTYKDNRFCREDRAKNLEALQLRDLNHYRVKCLGLWGGALKGLIYENWNFADDIPEEADICFGLDYGFNNPTALVQVGFHEKKLFVKEIIYKSGLTPDEIANFIQKNLFDLVGKKPIIVDSANPDMISALRKRGFNASAAIKGPGTVHKGILEVKNYKLYITKDSSNMLKEIEAYAWKDNIDGSSSEEPIKLDDHTLDAMRYVVQTYGIRHWKKFNQDINITNNHSITMRRNFNNKNSKSSIGFF